MLYKSTGCNGRIIGLRPRAKSDKLVCIITQGHTILTGQEYDIILYGELLVLLFDRQASRQAGRQTDRQTLSSFAMHASKPVSIWKTFIIDSFGCCSVYYGCKSVLFTTWLTLQLRQRNCCLGRKSTFGFLNGSFWNPKMRVRLSLEATIFVVTTAVLFHKL